MGRPIISRADLREHPAFADLDADTSGNPCVWRNHHECDDCGLAWETTWSCRCDDECAGCGCALSAHDSDWIGPVAPELVALWGVLPEVGSPERDAAAAAAICAHAAVSSLVLD